MKPLIQPTVFQFHRCGINKDIKLNLIELNMDGISGTIKKLRDNFFYLQEIFDISEPLKMHIIFITMKTI